MVSGIRELINSGHVDGGAVVVLEIIPITFLQEIPLVEGKWLDRQVLELAEWSAQLHSQGYHLKEEDRPRLTSAKFIRESGEEVSTSEMQSLRQKTIRNLARFLGRTKKIQGRLYVHFEDYCSWKGRKVKGDLQSLVKEGLIIDSWNRWIGEHGGNNIATLAGIPVRTLSCYVNSSSSYSCPDGLEEHLQEREQLLENFRTWSFKQEHKEELIQEWKEAAPLLFGGVVRLSPCDGLR